jgi:hypothetical protein
VLDSEESLRFEVAWWRARRAGYLLEVHALDGPSGAAYWAVAGPRDAGADASRRFVADAPSRVAAAEAAVAVLEDIAAGRRKWPDAEADFAAVAAARS